MMLPGLPSAAPAFAHFDLPSSTGSAGIPGQIAGTGLPGQ